MKGKTRIDLATLKTRISRLRHKVDATQERLAQLNGVRVSDSHAVVERSRCTGCGICREICPRNAIRVTYVAKVNPHRCVGCGLCVENCPQNAIQLARASTTSGPAEEDPHA